MSARSHPVLTLAVIGVVMWAVVLFVQRQVESGQWRAPLVAMISLTVSNLAVAAACFMLWRAKRRKRTVHG
jgi:uncharacterized membrane protein YozB (DUF420 family)